MRNIAELENQCMKKLLAGAGISYSEKEIDGGGNEYDPDQGPRIAGSKIKCQDCQRQAYIDMSNKVLEQYCLNIKEFRCPNTDNIGQNPRAISSQS